MCFLHTCSIYDSVSDYYTCHGSVYTATILHIVHVSILMHPSVQHSNIGIVYAHPRWICNIAFITLALTFELSRIEGTIQSFISYWHSVLCIFVFSSLMDILCYVVFHHLTKATSSASTSLWCVKIETTHICYLSNNLNFMYMLGEKLCGSTTLVRHMLNILNWLQIHQVSTIWFCYLKKALT